MAAITLRVRARDGVLAPDYAALEHGQRRFVGRRYKKVSDDPEQWGFVDTEEAVVIDGRPENIALIREGAVICADDETAKLAQAIGHLAAMPDVLKEPPRAVGKASEVSS